MRREGFEPAKVLYFSVRADSGKIERLPAESKYRNKSRGPDIQGSRPGILLTCAGSNDLTSPGTAR